MKEFEGKKGRKGEGGRGKGHPGAKTFRRGRAMDFLEKLHVKRTTLKQQLDSGQFEDIKQVILGELKAVESIMDEYMTHFELHESKEIKEKITEDSQTGELEKGE
ncbi:MAG TPA: hypothetical protein VNR61_07340 [Niallia sp.]|nr:hypothetical protein [Niallia sp.]